MVEQFIKKKIAKEIRNIQYKRYKPEVTMRERESTKIMTEKKFPPMSQMIYCTIKITP